RVPGRRSRACQNRRQRNHGRHAHYVYPLQAEGNRVAARSDGPGLEGPHRDRQAAHRVAQAGARERRRCRQARRRGQGLSGQAGRGAGSAAHAGVGDAGADRAVFRGGAQRTQAEEGCAAVAGAPVTGGLTARAIAIGITGAIAGAIAGASAIGCLAAAPPTAGRAGMAEQRGQAFRQHLDAGMAALKAGTFAAAERRFAAAAELEPRAPEPRLLAAVAAERQFHHGAAAAWLRGAVAEAPWRADARAMLVSVLLRADKLAEAAAELGALRAHGGADERLLIGLQAAVRFRAHRYDQAVAEFSRLLARRADDPVGLCGFGVVRAVAGDLAGAESALARARAAAPTLALADYNLALVHYYAGRFDQAARASE